jgi:hypothetical protein
MMIGSAIQVIFRVLTQQFELLVLLMREIYDIRHRDGLRWHDINIPSFMNIGTGIQAVSRFYLRNLRGCYVGTTDRDL